MIQEIFMSLELFLTAGMCTYEVFWTKVLIDMSNIDVIRNFSFINKFFRTKGTFQVFVDLMVIFVVRHQTIFHYGWISGSGGSSGRLKVVI